MEAEDLADGFGSNFFNFYRFEASSFGINFKIFTI